ncbi:MAG: tetratricopeptide repeat protein [Aquincola sp.]|nr:tetratricopeptide repeat protein [Aquincola sp.]MDH5330929.1 tetratricopeptide repeat protein [Aquincola sp.]
MKRWAAAAVLWAACAAAPAAVDVDSLWNYDDPASSEARFRDGLASALGDDVLVLRTQIARTLGLRGRFEEAHRELDAIEPALASAGIEPRVRAWLERGRTWRSSGQPDKSRPLFNRAYVTADAAGLENLAADALHMLALAAPALDERVDWNRRTIDYAKRARDPRAQRWQAAAWNNIGNDLREAKRFDESLAAFRESLAAYEASGRAGGTRIARWQVANVLRLKGQADEALAMQLALERDAQAAGEPDPYVYDELALLHAARGDAERAARERAKAKELRDGRRP